MVLSAERTPSEKNCREKFSKFLKKFGALSKHKILKKGPFSQKFSNFIFSQKFSKMVLSAERSPFEKYICREKFSKNLKISQKFLVLYQNIKFSKKGHFSQKFSNFIFSKILKNGPFCRKNPI